MTATNLTGTKVHRDWTLAVIGLYLNSTFFGTSESQDTEIQSTLATLFEPMSYVSIYSHIYPSVEQPEALMQAAGAELIVAYSDGNVDMVTPAKTTNINKFKFLAMQFFYCTRSFQTRVVDGVPETKELESAIQVVSSAVHTTNAAWNKDFKTSLPGPHFESPCPDVVMNQSLVLAPPPGGQDGQAFTIDACTGLLASGELIASASGMAMYVDKAGYFTNTGILAGPVSLALQGGPNSRTIDQTTQWNNMEVLVNNVADSLTNM